MFSFHKPKIFRSSEGCCICKAKSSSSRFTDSKKYEAEFEKCFLIKNEIRTGEICNACVLLVKRCKKLPKETTKNWAHVVDARQGHKSTNKTKSQTTTSVSSPTKANRSKSSTASDEHKRAERKVCRRLLFNSQPKIVNENESNNVRPSCSALGDEELKIVQNVSTTSASEECDCSSCVYNRELDESERNGRESAQQLSNGIRRLKKTLTPKKLCTETASNSSSGNSSDSNDEDEDYLSDDEKTSGKFDDKMVTRSGQTITCSAFSSIDASIGKSTKNKNKRKLTVKHNPRNDSTFLDMTYWRRETVCCGIIFRNKSNDMVLIDSKLFNPCACRKKKLAVEEQSANADSGCKSEEEAKCMDDEPKLVEMEIEASSQTSGESPDSNNNFLSAEKITINLEDCLAGVDAGQLNESMLNDPINELVIVNSSSGISSDSSDISSITEEDEEDSNSSENIISDHNLLAKNMINRTFGVL